MRACNWPGGEGLVVRLTKTVQSMCTAPTDYHTTCYTNRGSLSGAPQRGGTGVQEETLWTSFHHTACRGQIVTLVVAVIVVVVVFVVCICT